MPSGDTETTGDPNQSHDQKRAARPANASGDPQRAKLHSTKRHHANNVTRKIGKVAGRSRLAGQVGAASGPGPGAYNPLLVQHTYPRYSMGGSTRSAGSSRFGTTPGPGEYFKGSRETAQVYSDISHCGSTTIGKGSKLWASSVGRPSTASRF